MKSPSHPEKHRRLYHEANPNNVVNPTLFTCVCVFNNIGQVNHSKAQSVKAGPCGIPHNVPQYLALSQSELNPKINITVSR